MTSDSAYFQKSSSSLNTLLQGAKGVWGDLPRDYLNYFNHTFVDGDVSLLPSLSGLVNTDSLDGWEIQEIVGALTKVNPKEWPDVDSIETIDAESFFTGEANNAPGEWEYVEDNLGTSERVQKALKGVLESVFGDDVSTIRSRQGKYPSPSNNFLQEKDGTFAGTFKFEGHLFQFEIAPTEAGWICTYRMDEDSLDKLEKPEFKNRRKDNKPNHRKVRSQGWR